MARNRKTLAYEIAGIAFIILLGSALHFTYELSGESPIVGVFSAVNESVWEHMKIAFSPQINIYKGRRTLQLKIIDLQPLDRGSTVE